VSTTALPQDELEHRMMAVIVQCSEVLAEPEFSRIIALGGPLHQILCYEMMLCGIGGVSRHGSRLHKVVNLNYPLEYFEPMRDEEGRLDTPLMKRWRATQAPVLFQGGRDDAAYPQEWVRVFRKHGLRNTMAHGVQDLTGTLSSFFVFSRLPDELGERHALVLRVLTPHLHMALARALTTVAEYQGSLTTLGGQGRKGISERQREILYWIHEGKTNREIAQILGLSALNVKYHTDQIYQKLEVRSRAQAVAKARDLGLLLAPRT
jgi:LuxR family transcriptional regulator, quorum-sensing system regulator CviR